METETRWEQLIANEAEIQTVLLGEAELPPFTGSRKGYGYQLYCTAEQVIDLFNGDFEAACAKLAGHEPKGSGLLCHQLASLWYEAETSDPVVSWQKLKTWMDCQVSNRTNRNIKRLLLPILALDQRLALHWAPLLSYYLVTLFSDWPEDILNQAAADRQTALENGVGEEILIRIDFLLRVAQAKQQKSVSQIVAAANEWQDLCRQNPRYGKGTEYMLEAAVALEISDQFTEALEWLDRFQRIDPDQYDLLLVKARILKRIGEIKPSLEVCDRLIGLFPDDYAGYCLRSNTYFLLGWNDLAMDDARKACEVAPENPNSYMSRAFVLMQTGNYEAALQDFIRTLEFDPDRYDALRGQGKCLSMLGRDYEALTCFNALRRVYPDDPDLYYELADVLFSAGYLEDCEKVCRQCLKLDKEYVSAYVILGMIALRKNDDDKAHKLLTKAVSMEPDNPFALNELAYLVHLEGDDDTALELVDRALEESPDYADALCNKGVVLFFRSEFDRAAVAFDQTLKLVPDHVAAWVGKGNTLTQLCDFDEALHCYDQALKLDPENADACHGKAVLYRMLGLDDEVRKWQERAYLLDNGQDED